MIQLITIIFDYTINSSNEFLGQLSEKAIENIVENVMQDVVSNKKDNVEKIEEQLSKSKNDQQDSEMSDVDLESLEAGLSKIVNGKSNSTDKQDSQQTETHDVQINENDSSNRMSQDTGNVKFDKKQIAAIESALESAIGVEKSDEDEAHDEDDEEGEENEDEDNDEENKNENEDEENENEDRENEDGDDKVKK